LARYVWYSESSNALPLLLPAVFVAAVVILVAHGLVLRLRRA